MRRIGLLLLMALAAGAQEVSQSGLELKGARPMVAQPERASRAMIASAHELATQAGLGILKRGGNAVDAAVAVAFALAVVHPEAGNLGGGGYLLARMADGRVKAIDYRETAPAAASTGMFKDPMEARVGYKASAVPGTVAGLAMAHAALGRKPWKEVLEPARRLARDGFPASQRMELILALQVPVMRQFGETAKIFLHGSDKPLKQGEIVYQPELAATIARLQKRGPREFYEGETARRIAADMAARGGTISYDDLKGYKAREVEPIRASYRGHPLLTMPPSTSGGMALVEMLNILEQFPLRLGMEGSSEVRHLMIEAMKRAYFDRSRHAADPAHFEIPLARLTSKEHAAALAATIRKDRATPSARLAEAVPATIGGGESEDTTHFSIIDGEGNIVTNTYTLNGFYGSQVIARGTGVLLNDIMSAFTRSSGSRNEIAAGRRPVSSMTPTLLLQKDGSPWVALGSPGAFTIPNTMLQVVVNLVDFKMSLRDAIEYPRIHHQYFPDRVDAEPAALVADVAERLRAMGHTLNPRYRSQGDVHAVAIENGWRVGWSDGRRGGRAAGF